MSNNKFSVILNGLLVPGFPKDDVVNNFAELYQIPVELLCIGKLWVLKTNVPEQMAKAYCVELKKLGAQCHAVQKTLGHDETFSDSFCGICGQSHRACLCASDKLRAEQTPIDSPVEYQLANNRATHFLQFGTATMFKRHFFALLIGLPLSGCAALVVDAGQEALYIGSELADCYGVVPQKCMLVKKNLGDEWEFFYDQITGFQYQEGYRYKLLVKSSAIEDPAQDASSIAYELIEVIEKNCVTC